MDIVVVRGEAAVKSTEEKRTEGSTWRAGPREKGGVLKKI